MALIIEQRFPSGRFHATRWNQGAFGDAYGEWPPSPWRLLRALAARWFQYVRENGESKDSEAEKRETVLKPLLQSLSDSLPAFYLPPLTWRGPALKQYQPTNLDWTDKSKAAAGYKKPQTTLIEDNYRAVPVDEPVFWHWESLNLEEAQKLLLGQLLESTLYFGRAESFSRLRRIAALPKGVEINCRLFERGSGEMSPVLVPLPNCTFDLAVLLAATDDKELKGRSIPPGTAWYYAQLPLQLEIARPTVHCVNYPSDLNYIQFAVGGRVYPHLRSWIKITERFRGKVIRQMAFRFSSSSRGRYDLLSPEQQDKLALITGKDGRGQLLRGHRHAFFLLWPDVHDIPSRLVVWRSSPFTSDEVQAFLAASERALAWEEGTPEWHLRLIPLPFETPPPSGLLNGSRAWVSATPFVPPAGRHRFRKNGRPRNSESPERLLTKMLQDEGKPGPVNVVLLEDEQEKAWVKLHETRTRRFSKDESRTPYVRPGFRLRVEFPTSVSGPLILGDSCHFGLGLFVPA
ncbi:MAG: type I-U CRISPR-associated protein Cas5/Cas6 [Acidobacteria bacterium]|nr:type I-U CRISPR-associated protein Cas5/Cas6 [Acidobacteriota bacterium]MBI3657496.1 type I-U CRISPR-associated protein Cas5/Cas6 [Acidobacteriota bacterium]